MSLDQIVDETMETVLALPGESRTEKLAALQSLTEERRDDYFTRLGVLEVVRSQIEGQPGPRPLPMGLSMAVSVRAHELAVA